MSERIMTDRIYHYFISYLSTGGESVFSFGNFAVERNDRIRSMEDIRRIEIEVGERLKKVVTITNWKLLRSVKKGSGNIPTPFGKHLIKQGPSKVE